MSFWNKIINSISGTEKRDSKSLKRDLNSSRYVIVDVEVGLQDRKIHDIGALRWDGAVYHSTNKRDLNSFLKCADFVCGHNIINHDAKYLFDDSTPTYMLVDTLFMAPLLFPERPYHGLLKNDKLIGEHLNNPGNDCKRALDLLMDEVAHWEAWPNNKKKVFATLLHDLKEFEGFFFFVNAQPGTKNEVADLIRLEYAYNICQHADIEGFVNTSPRELAYALALIDTTDYRSITPRWVLCNYPNVENLVRLLRSTKCNEGCPYCNRELDVHFNLKRFFGFDKFRTYDGEPLQESASRAAVEHKSLLAIFPTGGGKSLTFQLPR